MPLILHPSMIASGKLSSPPAHVQVCFPGAYRNVCVELRINHLAVNAILEVCGWNVLGGALGLMLRQQRGADLICACLNSSCSTTLYFCITTCCLLPWT